jgi:uncharacterized protein YkwD
VTRARASGRAVFAAIAVSALAVSGGFAADRLLFTQSASTFSIGAKPKVTSRDSGTPRPSRAERADDAPFPAPSLKPVRRAPASPPAGAGGKPTASPTPTAKSAAAAAEEAVIRLTNQERAANGCSPLRFDSRLRTAARRHSTDMGVHDFFSHTSPDGDTFADRIETAGYPDPGAENIARGYSTAAAVMKGWMNSEGHRANILNCGLRAIGVGIYLGPDGPWWTQDFGWP